MQSGYEVLDMWDGTPVGDCSIIQCLVVLTRMPVLSCFFLGTIWRGEANYSTIA